MNADTDNTAEESVKVIQGRVAPLYAVRTFDVSTMDNRHNKPSQVPKFLR